MTRTTSRSALFLLLAAQLFQLSQAAAQQTFKGLEPLFTTPRQYTAAFTDKAPDLDGKISDQVWANVPWSQSFVDIEGSTKPAPFYNTRCKMIWDKKYLYIAAELQEEHLWANVKNHDEVIFQDNDFEVFLDPDNNGYQYFEIEMNAINTVWELFLSKPYRNESGPLMSWDAAGLRTAVKAQGTINKAKDKDRGWTLEMAIPYSALNIGDQIKVPEPGDLWRINFSRVEWDTEIKDGRYVKLKDASGKNLPERNWVWSPQGVINMHYPERWGYLKFGTAASADSTYTAELPYAEKQKQYLWLSYYRQKSYQQQHGRYAGSLQELDILPAFQLGEERNQITMEATNHQFYLSLKAEGRPELTLNQDGLLQVLKK
jgi:hypothetical protein